MQRGQATTVASTRASFELQVRKRIREFDPFSLILLLKYHGYGLEQLQFRSHPSICSQETLFEAIEFKKEPLPHVLVSINMGLLAAQTCLPSYLLKQMEQAPVEALRFIQFFDHPLLGNFFKSLYPERDTRIFPDLAVQRRNQLLLLGLRAPCTLHLLLRLIFPELEVRVEKAVLPRALHTSSFILGRGALASGHVLGSTFVASVQGLRARLFSDTESAANGTPWAREVVRRLEERLFPLLKAEGVDLEIFLILRGQQSWAQLNQNSYLGYDSFKGGRAQARRLLIFSGSVVE